MTACTPKPNGPEPTAQAFFAALGHGDTGAAAELSDKISKLSVMPQSFIALCNPSPDAAPCTIAYHSDSPEDKPIVDCMFELCLTQCMPKTVANPVVLLLVKAQPA